MKNIVFAFVVCLLIPELKGQTYSQPFDGISSAGTGCPGCPPSMVFGQASTGVGSVYIGTMTDSNNPLINSTTGGRQGSFKIQGNWNWNYWPTRLMISEIGKIGINTDYPNAMLHIVPKNQTQVNRGDGNRTDPLFMISDIKTDLNTPVIEVTDENSTALFHLRSNGQVGIGVGSTTMSTNTDYRLLVDGKIICEELSVKLSEEWGDFVFQDTYHLTSLDSLENFIDTHRHLPGIEDAETLGKQGVEIGEMLRKQMIKIEELTLYIIEQNRKISALEAKLAQKVK